MTTSVNDILLFGAAPLAPAGNDYVRNAVLSFKGQYQAAENWCWAAVAASIQDSYRRATNGDAEPRTTQCSIADTDLTGVEPACNTAGQGELCARLDEPGQECGCFNRTAGEPGPKNREGFLNLTLNRMGLLEKSIVLGSGDYIDIPVPNTHGEYVHVDDTVDFDTIKSLIDLGRPVCLRIVRREFRHFIVIYGYEGYPDNDLLIWDPAEGSDVVDFDIFREMYGPFTHILVTKPPASPAAGGVT